jgi:hypothetical protein
VSQLLQRRRIEATRLAATSFFRRATFTDARAAFDVLPARTFAVALMNEVVAFARREYALVTRWVQLAIAGLSHVGSAPCQRRLS